MNIKKLHLIILLISLTFLSSRCGSDSLEELGFATSETDIPNPVLGAGQLTFLVDPSSKPDTVAGYVIGSREELKVESVGSTYYINNIPPGKKDIVVTAGSLAIPSLLEYNLLDKKERGLRKNEIEITANSSLQLKQLTIPIAGSLSGVVTLYGGTDHSGIDIFIPGTDVIAKSDKNGNFSFSQVPVGTHTVQYQFQSYGDVIVQSSEGKPSVVVESGKNTKLAAVQMYPSQVQGYLKVKDCDCFNAQEERPTVKIQASGEPTYMRLSDDMSSLPAESFVLYQAEFKLPSSLAISEGKERVIYLQLKDKTGVEGTITKNTLSFLPVSTEPLSLTKFQAATAANYVSGGVKLSWTFPENTANFQKLEIFRQAGQTATNCNEGTSIYSQSTVFGGQQQLNDFPSSVPVSYLACMSHRDSATVSTQKIENFSNWATTHMSFVTQAQYDGNMKADFNNTSFTSGIEGADARCQWHADSASPTAFGGKWKAMLSTGTSLSSRIPITNKIYNSIGEQVYSGSNLWSDLSDSNNCGSGQVFNPELLQRDENGNLISTGGAYPLIGHDTPNIWTGTESNGAASAASKRCNDWSSAETGSGMAGRSGVCTGGLSSQEWLKIYTFSCSSQLHLYCISVLP